MKSLQQSVMRQNIIEEVKKKYIEIGNIEKRH